MRCRYAGSRRAPGHPRQAQYLNVAPVLVQAPKRLHARHGVVSGPRRGTPVVVAARASPQATSPPASQRNQPSFWVTVLIVLNVVVFLLDTYNTRNLRIGQFHVGKALNLRVGQLTWMGAKINGLIALGEWWRLFTCTFLHNSWLHLAANMSFLSTVSWLEARLGSLRFLCVYIFSGALGSLVSYYMSRNPAVGASGACCGLLAAAFMYYSDSGRVLEARSRHASMWHYAVMALLNIFLIPMLLPFVDAWGHGGGFLGGLILSFLFGPRPHLEPATRRTADGNQEKRVILLVDEPRIPLMAHPPKEVSLRDDFD